MLPVTTQVELFANNPPVPQMKKYWCGCIPKKKKMHRYQPTRWDIDNTVQDQARIAFDEKKK